MAASHAESETPGAGFAEPGEEVIYFAVDKFMVYCKYFKLK